MSADMQESAGGRRLSLSTSPYARGLTELLDTLDRKTLLSLASTATSSRLLPENRKEAIEIILLYTENLSRLFSYKRMTAEVLMEYLHRKQVSVPHRASKLELIKVVQGELEKSVRKSQKSLTKVRQSTPRPHTTPDRAPPLHLPPVPSVNLTVTPSGSTNLNVSGAGVHMNLDVQLNAGVCGQVGDDKSKMFAREFCKWFYTMLNRLQPERCHLQGDMLSTDVFVSNASLDMYLYTGQQVIEKHAVGQQDTFSTLRDILIACRVCFAPDIDGGMSCEMSGHGMAKLQCRGTLHQQETLVGVFEQEVGLVVCPEGSWKVATLKSNLRQHVANVQPAINFSYI